MLILTRRPAETLRIGEDIAVTVLGIKGNQVRIGITAPSSVNILREELVRRDAAGESAGNSEKPSA